jgi:hypothetical protein
MVDLNQTYNDSSIKSQFQIKSISNNCLISALAFINPAQIQLLHSNHIIKILKNMKVLCRISEFLMTFLKNEFLDWPFQK